MAKRISKALAARNERLAKVVANIGEKLGQDHAEALNKYAASHGPDWAQALLDDWYSGRDDRFRDPDNYDRPLGHFLRQVRNSPVHGPAFYRAFHGE